jgi:uncharacterized protein with HEPN domain
MGRHKRALEALCDDIKGWIKEGTAIALRCKAGRFLNNTDFHAASWRVLCVGEASGKLFGTYQEFATGKLMSELKLAYAARNRIVHGHYDLDPEVIFSTINTSLRRLLKMLNRRLETYHDEPHP